MDFTQRGQGVRKVYCIFLTQYDKEKLLLAGLQALLGDFLSVYNRYFQDKNGNWPRSMLDTKVQISCPNNDYGQMTRVCANGIKPDIRTEPGKWGPVDQVD